MIIPAVKTPSGQPLRQILLLLGWYAVGIHRGIARYARDASWVLDAMAVHQAEIRPFWLPDGIVCMLGVNPAMDGLVKKLRLPTVNIGHHTTLPVPRVAADNRLVAAMATDHFAERGFKHFAFYYKGIYGPGELNRRDAFRQAVEKHGGQFHCVDASAIRGGRPTPVAMFKFLRGSLVKLPKPLAALGQVDDLAVEIITACRAEKIRVPEQVAVLGVGNDELLCDFAPVPLSSIDENLEAIGYTAARLLDELMKGRRVSMEPVLIPPVRVVTRQSSDILATERVEVATVLKNVLAHFREPISAAQVAVGVPMSYRRLQDLFVKHVGHSIFDEILRRRLDHAAKLLAETDLKLEAVASESGFSNINHFGKAFRRKRGITPGELRKLTRRGPE